MTQPRRLPLQPNRYGNVKVVCWLNVDVYKALERDAKHQKKFIGQIISDVYKAYEGIQSHKRNKDQNKDQNKIGAMHD